MRDSKLVIKLAIVVAIVVASLFGVALGPAILSASKDADDITDALEVEAEPAPDLGAGSSDSGSTSGS